MEIFLKDIDFKDKTFLFRYKVEDKFLYESIKKYGILSPIGLSKNNDNKYKIIYGFKRIIIAKALRFTKVPARVFNKINDELAVQLILADNINSVISELDKANLLFLIKKTFNFDIPELYNYWNENFNHKLSSKKQLQEYLNLQKQPDFIKQALLNQDIDLNKAFFLSNIELNLSKILLELNRHCKLNYNQLKQLYSILEELRYKLGIKFSEFVKSLISYIKNKNKNQRYECLYKRLIALRSPKFYEYMNKYKQIRRDIVKGIPKEIISITTHPFFEEDKISLTLKVDDEKKLQDTLNKLLIAIKDNRFKKLFDIVHGVVES